MIVWLASYPRSGNTFFRVILNSIFDIKTYSIYDDNSDVGADSKTSDIVGHEFLPENFSLEKAREENSLYVIKTHELVDENDKVIYLIRDGRESTLSFTKYLNDYYKQNQKIIDTIYGNTFVGFWGNHVSSWCHNKSINKLVVKFEVLIKDPMIFIEKTSTFLDIIPVNTSIPTFEELKQVNPVFFRSGKTNSWEQYYTEEENIAFWLKNYYQMMEFGYDNKVPEIIESSSNLQLLNEFLNQNSYMMKLLFDQTKRTQSTHQMIKKVDEKTNNILESKNKTIYEKNIELKKKDKIILQKDKALEDKDKEIKSILSSKTFRIGYALAYPYLKMKK